MGILIASLLMKRFQFRIPRLFYRENVWTEEFSSDLAVGSGSRVSLSLGCPRVGEESVD